MSLHQSIEYQCGFEDEGKAEEIFQKYFAETNASRNAIHFDYLLTKENGNFYVNELGETNNDISGRRALITDNQLIEGVLKDEKLEEIKERYDELAKESYSNSSS